MPERDALNQLEDQKRAAVCFADVVDRANVGMAEGRGGARFAFEPGPAVAVAEPVLQDLDRDLTPEATVARAINLAHSAFAERRENLVGPSREPMVNNTIALGL